MKKTRHIIIDIVIILTAIWMVIEMGRYMERRKEVVIIKDPVVIYDNLKIEKIDTRGLYGVISEVELKKILKFQDRQPFQE